MPSSLSGEDDGPDFEAPPSPALLRHAPSLRSKIAAAAGGSRMRRASEAAEPLESKRVAGELAPAAAPLAAAAHPALAPRCGPELSAPGSRPLRRAFQTVEAAVAAAAAAAATAAAAAAATAAATDNATPAPRRCHAGGGRSSAASSVAADEDDGEGSESLVYIVRSRSDTAPAIATFHCVPIVPAR